MRNVIVIVDAEKSVCCHLILSKKRVSQSGETRFLVPIIKTCESLSEQLIDYQ